MTNPTNHENDAGDRVGPYATPQDAAADARIISVRHETEGIGLQQAGYDRLVAECGRAGVALGIYDSSVAWWVSGHEREVGQVILGLIARAYDSGLERGSATGYGAAVQWDQENPEDGAS